MIMNTVFHSQIVVVDPGHGYCSDCTQSSCTSAIRLTIEIETAMATGLKLKSLLATCPNVTTHLTRNSNACGDFPTVSQRRVMSNNWGADVFLSIHTNGFDGTARGTETYYNTLSNSSSAQNSSFSALVQNQIQPIGPFLDRGVKTANLGVLRYNNAVCCLNEIAFGDNTQDAAILSQDSKRQLFAEGFLNAIQSQLGITCTPTPPVTCSTPIQVDLGVPYQGSTYNGQDVMNKYGCSPADENGKEIIHKFTITDSSSVEINITDLQTDLDVHLLTDSCDASSCINRDDNYILEPALGPGTYYVSVDGFGVPGTEGTYTLTIDATLLNIPEGYCENPIPISCNTTYNGTTFNGQNVMNKYGCSPLDEYGKEKVHVLELNELTSITASLSNLAVNLDVYLLTDSCNANSCIAWGYNALALDSLAPGRYYVVVDGQGANGVAESGDYTLEITCALVDSSVDTTNNNSSIEDYLLSASQINLYPNPTSTSFTFEFSSELRGTYQYAIYSLDGRKVVPEVRFNHNNTNTKQEVNINDLPKGNYLFILTSDKATVSKRLVKI